LSEKQGLGRQNINQMRKFFKKFTEMNRNLQKCAILFGTLFAVGTVMHKASGFQRFPV